MKILRAISLAKEFLTNEDFQQKILISLATLVLIIVLPAIALVALFTQHTDMDLNDHYKAAYELLEEHYSVVDFTVNDLKAIDLVVLETDLEDEDFMLIHGRTIEFYTISSKELKTIEVTSLDNPKEIGEIVLPSNDTPNSLRPTFTNIPILETSVGDWNTLADLITQIKAVDYRGNDISTSIVIDDSNLDLNNIGTYSIVLSVADESGNANYIEISVEIKVGYTTLELTTLSLKDIDSLYETLIKEYDYLDEGAYDDLEIFFIGGEMSSSGDLTVTVDGFEKREVPPSEDNPYYYSSKNILYRYGFVNECTWYAYGRSMEILQVEDFEGLVKGKFINDALKWWPDNQYLLEIGNGFSCDTDINNPKIGAIIVLGKGTWFGDRYAGHVLVVEAVYEDGTIDVSEGGQGFGGFNYRSRITPESLLRDGYYTWLGYIYLIE